MEGICAEKDCWWIDCHAAGCPGGFGIEGRCEVAVRLDDRLYEPAWRYCDMDALSARTRAEETEGRETKDEGRILSCFPGLGTGYSELSTNLKEGVVLAAYDPLNGFGGPRRSRYLVSRRGAKSQRKDVMPSLAEELPKEIERCQELLGAYKEIGVNGQFAVAMIKNDIKEGVESLASGDVIRMIKAYERLKGCS